MAKVRPVGLMRPLEHFYHLEMIMWHCVLTKFKDKIFKICTYFMSQMTKEQKSLATGPLLYMNKLSQLV